MKLEVINICLGCIVIIVALFFLLKKENYASGDKCSQLATTYCNLIKSGKVDNLGDGARKVLFKALQECGADSHLDVSQCYPNWATRIGGTHFNPLYPQI